MAATLQPEFVDLSSEELVLKRLEVAMLLYAIDKELFTRKFEHYRTNRPATKLSEADLVDERAAKGLGLKKARAKKATKSVKTELQGMANVLAALTPEERQRIQDAMKALKK